MAINPYIDSILPELNIPPVPQVDVNQQTKQNLMSSNRFGQGIDQALSAPSSESALQKATTPILTPGVNAERFPIFNPGVDNEEEYAKAQSFASKAVNGIGKMVGTATTSFVNGTAGLIYGGYRWAKDGKFSSLYDNDLSRQLDEMNKSLEDSLPNYYTHKEKNADWYSPDNFLTANFIFDKVIKNLGFSFGAMAAGGAWSLAFKGIGLTAALTRAGQSISPIASELEAANTIANVAERTAKITQILNAERPIYQTALNTIGKGLQMSDRAITAAFGTFGEAGIESLQSLNEFRTNAIQAYKDSHYGEAPTGEDLDKINKYAERVGNTVFGLNTALLTATNYVQLPKILGDKYSSKKLLQNGVEKEINSIVKDKEGKFVTNLSLANKATRIANKAKNIGGLFFSPSEAFEEGAQFSIQSGVDNFYSKKLEDKKDLDGFLNDLLEGTLSSEGALSGIKKTLTTKEGMESILIGGLSGGLQQSGFIGTYRNDKGSLKVGFGKSGELAQRGFTGEGGERGKNTQEALEALNNSNFKSVLEDNAKTLRRSVAIAGEMEDALLKDDKYAYKNAASDYTFNYLQSRIKYGKIDAVQEDINFYKAAASTVEGFESLKQQGIVNEGQPKEDFLQKLSKFEQDAKFVNESYKKVNEKYANRVGLDGTAFSQNHLDALVLAQYKMKDIDTRALELSNDLLSKGVDVSQIANFSPESITKYKELLESIDKETSITDDEKQDLKEKIVDTLNLFSLRRKYISQYNDILKNPKKWQDIFDAEDVQPEDLEKESPVTGKTVKVNTATGVKDLSVGVTYNVVANAKNINDEEVSLLKVFTIVDKNDDKKTITIKTPDGKQVEVDQNIFKGYKIGTHSETLKNKTASFLLDNLNSIFEYKLGKGQKPLRGKLRWSGKEGVLLFVYQSGNTIKEKEVYGKDFVARDGYLSAKVEKVGEVSTEYLKSLKGFRESDASKKEEQDLLNKRKAIITRIVNDSKVSLDETNKKILTKVEQLNKLQEKLNTLLDNVEGVDKRTKKFKILTQSLTDAQNLYESISQEVENLKVEKDFLEEELSFYDDALKNVAELSRDSDEFLEELKVESERITALRDNVLEQVSTYEKIKSSLEKTIEKLIDFISNIMKSLNISEISEAKQLLSKGGVYSETMFDALTALQDSENQLKFNQEKLKDLNNFILEWTPKAIKSLQAEQKVKEKLYNTFAKIKADFEKRKELSSKMMEDQKFIQDVNNELFVIDKDSGEIATNSNEEDLKVFQFEPPKKTINIVFRSSNEPSSESENVSEMAKRRQVFFNTVAKSKKSFIATLVTPALEKELGVEGLLDALYSENNIPEDHSDESKGKATLAHLYLEKGKNGILYFINENGERIKNEAGEDLVFGKDVLSKEDVLKLVAGVFPSTRTTDDVRKEAIVPESQIEQLQEGIKAWAQQRKSWLEITDKNKLPQFEFTTSSGTIVSKDVNGNLLPAKSVTETFYTLDEIKSDSTVVVVSKTGKLTLPNDVKRTVIKGRPLLKYGGGYYYLNNRNLTEKEQDLVFNLLKSLADNFNFENRKFDPTILKFLQNILYFGNFDTNSVGRNQIFVKLKDDATADPVETLVNGEVVLKQPKAYYLVMGTGQEVPFESSSFTDPYFAGEIKSFLKTVYNNINSKTLEKDSNEPFSEIVKIKENGEFETREWSSYREYLLSNENPDGSKRTVDEIPLTINAPVKQEEVSNDVLVNNIYAIFQDLELPIITTKAEKENKPSVSSAPYTPLNSFLVRLIDNNEGDVTVMYKAVLNRLANGGEDIIIDEGVTTPITISLENSTVDTGEGLTLTKEAQDIILTYYTNKYNLVKNKTVEKTDDHLIIGILQEDPEEDSAPFEETFNPEEDVTPEETPDVQKTSVKIPLKNKFVKDNNNNPLRKAFDSNKPTMSKKDWKIFKSWMSENLPDVPVFELEEMIRLAGTDEKAWGMLKDKALHIYKFAAKGTEYHEAFEYVWNHLLTDKQQNEILKELRVREGNFFDITTGKRVNFATATPLQLKEYAAEMFGKYKRSKATSISEKLKNFFDKLISFIESFFLGKKPSLLQNLFEEINRGEFKNKPVIRNIVQPQFKKAYGLSEEESNSFVKHTYVLLMSNIIARGNNILYNVNESKLSLRELFDPVKENYIKDGILEVDENGNLLEDYQLMWNDIVNQTQSYMLSLGISFEEAYYNKDSEASINDENRNRNDYGPSAFHVDHKKTAFPAIKFILSSLIEAEFENGDVLGNVVAKRNPNTNMYETLKFSKVFITIMSNLANHYGYENVISELVKLAKHDPNYIRVLTRLKIDPKTGQPKFNEFTEYDWRLLTQFYGTFAKQGPSPVNISKEGGSSFIQNAILQRASEIVKSKWLNSLRVIAKNNNSFIKFDSNTKEYYVDEEVRSLLTFKGGDKEIIKFLASLGIDFSNVYKKLNSKQKVQFAEQSINLVTYILKNRVKFLSPDTLGIGGPLIALSELYAAADNTEFSSTYFNIEGQPVQIYDNHNYVSKLEAMFNDVSTLDELYELMPNLKDVFATNSIFTKKGGLYFDKDGNRTTSKIKVGTFAGVNNLSDGNATTADSLNENDTVTSKINNLINNNHYILIPADSSTEWMLKFENPFSASRVFDNKYSTEYYKLFTSYLEDEVNLAKQGFTNLKYVKNRTNELRFFKEIISSEKLHSELKEVISGDVTFEQFLKENKELLHEQLDEYLKEKVETLKKQLLDLGEVFENLDGNYVYLGLDGNFLKGKEYSAYQWNSNDISKDEFDKLLTFIQLNEITSNIEMHKLIFGDPYQFQLKINKSTGEEVLDETKRIKSWLSPRRSLFLHPEFNNFHNDKMNKVVDEEGNEIPLSSEDFGYNSYRDYMNSVTVQLDSHGESIVGSTYVKNQKEGYDKVDEADASSGITIMKYRELKQRSGQWPDEAEEWYQWEMSYMRNSLYKKNPEKYPYSSDKLKKYDENVLAKNKTNPSKFVLDVLKPIVTGAKYNVIGNEQILDKTSQMPIFYSMTEIETVNEEGKVVKEPTAMQNLFLKMIDENRDYYILISGRKVGQTVAHPLYNDDGTLNTNEFNNNEQIDLNTWGIQVENGYNGPKEQTYGTQAGKESTLDLIQNGVPLDVANSISYDDWNSLSEEEKENLSPLHKLIKVHTEHRRELVRLGYENLLKKFGAVDKGDVFEVKNQEKLQKVILTELRRRNVSDNAYASIELDANKNFKIPLESSNFYGIIKDILWSIANKNVVQPSMSGGPKVQVPVTLWENAKEGRKIVLKTEEGYKEISREEYNNLSDKDKENVRLTSSTLKFYTEEEPWMEVMLPCWFKDTLKKSDKLRKMSDAQIIDYLNSTEEGKSLLMGIGFRIPTQGMNSIEVFKVKAFLPKSMGSTIVVPSEITAKAGSDFDIDKLNTYLKNVYIDKNGDLKVIPFLGYGEAAIKQFGDLYLEKILNERVNNIDWNNVLQKFEDGEYLGEDSDEDFNFSDDEGEKTKNEVFKLYKQSIENAYFESFENLLKVKENYPRLVTANTDKDLKDLSANITNALNETSENVKTKLLDFTYLTKLRNSFLTGKKWVGVAAVNLTGHALYQRFNSYINLNNLQFQSEADKTYLKDGKINLKHNKVLVNNEEVSSLSGIKNVDNQYISDILSQFANAVVDIAKDPFIMKIISSDYTIGVAMFLTRTGVSVNSLGYFLNQPIIREFINNLNKERAKTVYSNSAILTTQSSFYSNKEVDTFNEDSLLDNIEDYYSGKKFSAEKNAEQLFILDEFLKYCKLADQNFKITQATNFDTTKFRNGDLVFRKNLLLEASNTNMISSAKELLDSSFIGELNDKLLRTRNLMSTVFKFEEKQVRDVLDRILTPYAKGYLGTEDFSAIGTKLTQSFLDYLILTEAEISSQIKNLKVDVDNVFAKIEEVKKKGINNYFLNSVTNEVIDGENTALALKVVVNKKEAYDQNMLTDSLRELRDDPETNSLYFDIVNTALLQGTAISPFAFTDLIPIEDYVNIVAPLIKKLDVETLINFEKIYAFQRNNWKNDKIVPTVKPYVFVETDRETGFIESAKSFSFPLESNQYSKNILSYGKNALYLQLLDSPNSTYDAIKIKRIVYYEKNGVGFYYDYLNNFRISGKTYQQYKAEKNPILKEYIGYVKVKEDGQDVIHVNNKSMRQVVYKQINLWGDGRTVEYHNEPSTSSINNNTLQTNNEIPDSLVIETFSNFKNILSDAVNVSSKREYTPENITSLKPNEVFVFGANTVGGHGGGTAGLAQRGTASSNYTALPIGTKGKWSEYGVVDKLMEGTEGKSFGIVTKSATISGTSLKIGGKRSVPLNRIEESINKLIETAEKNPELKFLVTKFGTNMAGFTIKEMRDLLIGKNLPDNIILPKEFEVRDDNTSTDTNTISPNALPDIKPTC